MNVMTWAAWPTAIVWLSQHFRFERKGLVRRLRPRDIVELGPGSCRKVRWLLDALDREDDKEERNAHGGRDDDRLVLGDPREQGSTRDDGGWIRLPCFRVNPPLCLPENRRRDTS